MEKWEMWERYKEVWLLDSLQHWLLAVCHLSVRLGWIASEQIYRQYAFVIVVFSFVLLRSNVTTLLRYYCGCSLAWVVGIIIHCVAPMG